MSTLELEPVDTDRDSDVPSMIHIVPIWPEGNKVALCGTVCKGQDVEGEETDCVVCVAEAERKGIILI